MFTKSVRAETRGYRKRKTELFSTAFGRRTARETTATFYADDGTRLFKRALPAVSVIDAEGPPVPIPNTEVKLCSGENTWLETAREDSS